MNIARQNSGSEPPLRFAAHGLPEGLTLDPATGVLHGSLYVIGSGDPALFPENAMMIADKLNRSGIREVDGNLVVLGQFFFNFSTAPGQRTCAIA